MNQFVSALRPESLPCPACVVRGDGGVLYANAAWRAYCAAFPLVAEPRSDGVPRWSDVLHPDDRASISAGAAGAMNVPDVDEEPDARTSGTHGADAVSSADSANAAPRFDAQVRVRHRDGAYRWCRCLGKAGSDPDGGELRWVVLLLDEPGHSAAESRQGERERRFAASLASLAHTLRNPMQALRHALFVLRLPNLQPEEHRRMLDLQERQVDALSRELAAFFEPNPADPPGLSAQVTVRSLLESVLREASPTLRVHDHRVTVLMEEPTLAISVDEGRVARDVARRWHDAILPHAGGVLSRVTARRLADYVDLELVVEPVERGLVARDGARRNAAAEADGVEVESLPSGIAPAREPGVNARSGHAAPAAGSRHVYRIPILISTARA